MKKPEPIKTEKHYCQTCKRETDCVKSKFRGVVYYHCMNCLLNADEKLKGRYENV